MIGKTVNCEGKNLQDVLKLDRSWLPLLQEVDPGIAQLNVIQWFINAGKRPDASMMKWCAIMPYRTFRSWLSCFLI